MLRVAIVLTVAGIGLAGAAHGQSRSLTEAEKKIIANAYGSNLKDPQSAQYQWVDLVVDPSTKGDEVIYCFRVNAKNSYGGYTGFHTIGGFVKRKNERIISYRYNSGSDDDDAIMIEATEQICRTVGYRFR